jgi:ABC-2 type transport system permease protein
MAPLPTNLVAFEKILFGGLKSALAALIVFPMVLVFPNSHVHTQINPALLVAEINCHVPGGRGARTDDQHQLEPSPSAADLLRDRDPKITFLGCIYYPWAALSKIRWLQIATLANPLVYVSEGLRAALTPSLQHMPWPASLSVLILFFLALTVLGTRGFRKRVLD